MPDAAASRKPRRFWLFAPYVLVLIAFALWSAYWFYARGQVLQALDNARKPQSGYTLSYDRGRVGGYPFRFETELTNPRLSERSGWALAAPSLQVISAAYNPTHAVIVAPRGVTLTRPNKGPVEITGKVLRASVADLQDRPRISVEARDITLVPVNGGTPMPFGAAKVFELHLRPTAGDLTRLFFGLEGAIPTPGTLMARATDGATNLNLEGDLTHSAALKGSNWPALLTSWSAAGGEMRLVRAEAQVGQAVMSAANSTLSADESGRLRGKLDLRLRQGPDAVMALGATGVLPSETAAVGAGLVGNEAHFVLHFRGGDTFVGPLPIGRAPKLY